MATAAALAAIARKQNATQLTAMNSSPDPRAGELAAAMKDLLEDKFSPEERAWFDRIEELRRRLNARTDRIRLVDYGSGEHQGRTREEAYNGLVSEVAVGETAAKRSKRAPWTLALFEIVRHTGARNALELGTAYGISAAFQAAAQKMSGGGRFTSIEGDPAQAAIARDNLAELGLEADVVEGRFQDVLDDVAGWLAPLDYVFVDGHHERNATIEYFEQLLPALADGAVVVFDDISWSDGMRDAWRTVSSHQRVSVALDAIAIGVCVVRDAPEGQEPFRLLGWSAV